MLRLQGVRLTFWIYVAEADMYLDKRRRRIGYSAETVGIIVYPSDCLSGLGQYKQRKIMPMLIGVYPFSLWPRNQTEVVW